MFRRLQQPQEFPPTANLTPNLPRLPPFFYVSKELKSEHRVLIAIEMNRLRPDLPGGAIYDDVCQYLNMSSLESCIIEMSELCLDLQMGGIPVCKLELVYQTHIINVDEPSYSFDDHLEQKEYIFKVLYESAVKQQHDCDNRPILLSTLKLLVPLLNSEYKERLPKRVVDFFELVSMVTDGISTSDLVRKEFERTELFIKCSPFYVLRNKERAGTSENESTLLHCLENQLDCRLAVRTTVEESENSSAPSEPMFSGVVNQSKHSKPTVSLIYLPQTRQLRTVELQHNYSLQDVPEDCVLRLLNGNYLLEKIDWKTYVKNRGLYSSFNIIQEGSFTTKDLALVVQKLKRISLFYQLYFKNVVSNSTVIKEEDFYTQLIRIVEQTEVMVHNQLGDWRGILQ